MLGALGQLLGRAANTVNNDVIQPINRDVVQPAHNLLWAQAGGAIRHVLGNPEEQAGIQVQQQANQKYQFTPAFNSLIGNAHPIVRDNIGNRAVADSFPTKSRGPFAPWNGINLSQGGDNTYPLLHEGLHDAYAHQTPQMKQTYLQDVQTALNNPSPTVNEAYSANAPVSPKTLKQFVDNSLSTYPGYKGVNSLNNVQALSPNLQTEIHSFVPEFYQNASQALPQNLANYYSQYFNPNTIAPTGRNYISQQPKQSVTPTFGSGALTAITRSGF